MEHSRVFMIQKRRNHHKSANRDIDVVDHLLQHNVLQLRKLEFKCSVVEQQQIRLFDLNLEDKRLRQVENEHPLHHTCPVYRNSRIGAKMRRLMPGYSNFLS